MSKLSFTALRNRDFRFLLLTRVFSSFAMQAQAVVVGWQVYSLTKSPFILGLTGLAEAVPAISCALIAGHIVDNSRPHRVYVFCYLALALNMLMLMLIAGGIVDPPGGHLLGWIFAGIFLSGLARSFAMPASSSLLQQIVPRKDMPGASAWLNSGFQMSAIAGPAVAGIIYGGYGPRAAWMLTAFCMCGALVLIHGVRGARNYRNAEKRLPAVQSIREGWSFILNNRVLLAMMGLDMLAVLFGGAVAMLPAYADQVLHIGSQGLGVLRAAMAIGAIVTALVLAVQPMKKVTAVQMLWVVTGFGICMIGFGLSTSFWLSMLFLIIAGAFDSVSVVIRGTMVQLLTPDHMLGRVASVSSMFIISSNELGAFESGTLAKVMGLVPSVVAGGIGTLIVVALTAIASPELRRTVVDADKAE
jgi:MFS family permease